MILHPHHELVLILQLVHEVVTLDQLRSIAQLKHAVKMQDGISRPPLLEAFADEVLPC